MVPSLRHIPPGAGEAAGGELGHPHVQGGHHHHAGGGVADLGAGEHGREPRAEGDVLGDDLPPGAALHRRQPLRAAQVREELGPQLRASQQLAQTTTRLNYLLRHFIYLFYYLLFTLLRSNTIYLNM